jgi:uncharacterized protein YchJ
LLPNLFHFAHSILLTRPGGWSTTLRRRVRFFAAGIRFVARFLDKDGGRSHHERGQFKRKGKKWLFTEEIMVKSQPLSSSKVGRNDPCSCSSGQK